MSAGAATADRKVAMVIDSWLPRFLANDLDYLDVRRTLDDVKSWSEWAPAWEAAADRYETLGEEALGRGRTVTGADHLRRAALTLQFAHFVLTDDEARRETLHRRQAALYARAAPLQCPPAESITVGFEGVVLRGYVRRPLGGGRPGVAILIPGLESTKEQFSTYEPYFLERGVATVSFEGPGQGESWYALAFRDADYRRAVGELARTVGGLDGVDPGRVVVVGTSFGGYLALRCATAFGGLVGVVSIAGPYDLAGLADLLPVVQDGFTRIVKAADRAEAHTLLSDVTLDGVLDGIAAPALIVHGARDRVIPPVNASRIAAALGDRAATWIEPEGSHSCNNLHTRIRPAIADWVSELLDRVA